MKNVLNTLIFLLFLAIGCTGPSSSQEGRWDGGDTGMNQFSGEKEFQDAHENPEEIAFEGKGKMIEFATKDGRSGHAYAVMSDTYTENYLLVIHEWWGLNDHIKREAERWQAELGNIHVLALDLYDGNIATDPQEAEKYMGMVKNERAEAIINGALTMVGKEAKVMTVGWCFGGGWSLKASILAGDQAAGCVMYYGMPVQTPQELAPLKADVLAIFARQDKWINEDVMNKFQALAKATGKNLTVSSFDADHAFANPSSPRYNEQAARQANYMAMEFLEERMPLE